MLDFLDKPSVLIVLLVVIVVFGAKRLPDSARALGRSMRILKAEAKGLKEDGTASETGAPAPRQLPETTTSEQQQDPQQQSPHQT